MTFGDRERVGWWLVNPVTGATIDQLDDGGGATLVEYGQRVVAAVHHAPWWVKLGLCVGLTILTMKTLLGFMSGGSSGLGGLALDGALIPIHHAACH